MIYLEHFGLREPPFTLTPDTSFYFNTTGHREALEVLQVAIDGGEGFIKIIGEVGTGKTLLCRKLLDQLEAPYLTAYLPNPLLGPVEIYRAVASELGLDVSSRATANMLLSALNSHLIQLCAAGHRVVLCIDEVQAMAEKSLEALRLLSNLETEKSKLLQIVLFAQPELDVRLRQDCLRQLRQRIVFSYRLPPLNDEGIRDYVAHRMLVAGHQGGAPLSPAAMKLLRHGSCGIPRLVNILCHKALMAAYGQGGRRIEAKHLQVAIADTEDAVCPKRGWLLAGGALATLGLAVLAGFFLKGMAG